MFLCASLVDTRWDTEVMKNFHGCAAFLLKWPNNIFAMGTFYLIQSRLSVTACRIGLTRGNTTLDGIRQLILRRLLNEYPR